MLNKIPTKVNKTIGIIICKKDNHFVMQYCSDDRIFNTIYKGNKLKRKVKVLRAFPNTMRQCASF